MLRFSFEDPDPHRPEQMTQRPHDAAATAVALRTAGATLGGLTAWTPDAIEAALRGQAEQIGWSSRDLFMALRVAVTGRTVTPPLIESISRLSKATGLNRLDPAPRAPAPAA